jgi:RNA recognition motif-containing protein
VRIFVGNLNYGTTDEALRELFEQHGDVVSAQVVTDRETGRSRGFGFVEMNDDEAGRRAIEALDKQVFDGRTLTVDQARPRGGRR